VAKELRSSISSIYSFSFFSFSAFSFSSSFFHHFTSPSFYRNSPIFFSQSQPGEAGTNRRLACQSSFFEQEVTEGTEELRADAPAFIVEIARCF
jgi:hypothetical protein